MPKTPAAALARLTAIAQWRSAKEYPFPHNCPPIATTRCALWPARPAPADTADDRSALKHHTLSTTPVAIAARHHEARRASIRPAHLTAVDGPDALHSPKEGKPRQHWSFVKPFPGLEEGGLITYLP